LGIIGYKIAGMAGISDRIIHKLKIKRLINTIDCAYI
jgi:hypothetical protein